MQVEIVAPELGGYESNREVVFKTLDKFDKYLHDFPDDGIFARVALRPHQANKRMVDATIDLSIPNAPKIIAKGEGENAREALGDAADEVERQLRDLKEHRSFS